MTGRKDRSGRRPNPKSDPYSTGALLHPETCSSNYEVSTELARGARNTRPLGLSERVVMVNTINAFFDDLGVVVNDPLVNELIDEVMWYHQLAFQHEAKLSAEKLSGARARGRVKNQPAHHLADRIMDCLKRSNVCLKQYRSQHGQTSQIRDLINMLATLDVRSSRYIGDNTIAAVKKRQTA